MAIKLSKKYIRHISSRFGLYSLGIIAVVVATIHDTGPVVRGIGNFLLIVIEVLIALSPTIVVQLFDIKVKHPKPYFVEPKLTRLKGALLVGPPMLLFGFLGIALGANLNWPDNAIFALGLFGFVLPINIYMVNACVRYKRIVEYGTTEWHKLQKARKR